MRWNFCLESERIFVEKFFFTKMKIPKPERRTLPSDGFALALCTCSLRLGAFGICVSSQNNLWLCLCIPSGGGRGAQSVLFGASQAKRVGRISPNFVCRYLVMYSRYENSWNFEKVCICQSGVIALKSTFSGVSFILK